ncbi:MAG TPA: anti-sigma factor antagonist [Rhodobacteraceae bacterium]|nr:anti-sigma factor antagonist [Paracoccaceae bacterium]
MQLETETRDNTLIITAMMDRIDAAIAIQFKDTMRDTAANGPARVVLDLSKVDFLDSSGLGAVVATMKLLAPEQTLELAGLTPNVEKVFRLTRMNSVFTIHKDKEAAFDDIAEAS